MEEHLFLVTPHGRLFAAYHAPEANPRTGIVLCPPFAEEQKASYRNFVEFAREATQAGLAVLRFDYLGTGDSEGSFDLFDLDAARKQVQYVARYLRERSGARLVGALGLRLGANLALEAFSPGVVDLLVLWQPLPDGDQFYRENLRRQQLRRKLMASSAQGVVEATDTIDLDGYALKNSTAEQIRALALPSEWPPCPILFVQVSHTTSPLNIFQPVAQRLKENFKAARMEPFWLRLGLVDTSELNRLTLEWLSAVERSANRPYNDVRQ